MSELHLGLLQNVNFTAQLERYLDSRGQGIPQNHKCCSSEGKGFPNRSVSALCVWGGGSVCVRGRCVSGVAVGELVEFRAKELVGLHAQGLMGFQVLGPSHV